MKYILISVMVLCALASCKKKTKENALVIKDCTGSYLHINDKDYLICNSELVDNIESGTKLSVTYQNTKNCDILSPTLCELYHKNEGTIEITKIN